MQISNNFYLSEFKGVMPEQDLLDLLQEVRDYAAQGIKITDSIRTVKEHIAIYHKLYGEEWLTHIPWGSKHLPSYNQGLRAVDMKIKNMKGEYLGKAIELCAKKLDIKIGLGVGMSFCHVDVRDKDARWAYKY